MAFKLDWHSSALNQNIDKMSTKLGAVILMYASTKASAIEANMKIKRPWTDRTGMAKATLSAKVSQPNSDLIRITLSHGVDYGIWLELAHGKNYAIIGPTIDQEGPKIVSELDGIMSKFGV